MNARFSGQNVVVTGAGQGIGAATARRFAVEGASVAVVDLDLERAERTAEDLGADPGVVAAGGSARAWKCDVTDQAAVEDVFARIIEAHGGLDVLVNNAGIARDNLLFRMELDDWQAVLTTNLTSAYLCARAAQAHMVARRSGKIVNLSSRSALGNVGQANYAAAKAGIQGLTATLAMELGRFNINVNAVAPGYIATSMTAQTAQRVGTTPEEHQQTVAARTPLGRVGQPEEVASVIAFLASDDASYVSGQTVYINGGAR